MRQCILGLAVDAWVGEAYVKSSSEAFSKFFQMSLKVFYVENVFLLLVVNFQTSAFSSVHDICTVRGFIKTSARNQSK